MGTKTQRIQNPKLQSPFFTLAASGCQSSESLCLFRCLWRLSILRKSLPLAAVNPQKVSASSGASGCQSSESLCLFRSDLLDVGESDGSVGLSLSSVTDGCFGDFNADVLCSSMIGSAVITSIISEIFLYICCMDVLKHSS